MFTDQSNCDYKMQCKYDFYFQGDYDEIAGNGYRIATRHTDQTVLEDPNKLSPRAFGLVKMDANEVRREKIWQLLSKNLFEFPVSP